VQMIDAGVDRLDAVVYTHAHADHIHGIDDLRGFFLVQRQLIPLHADLPTLERLRQSFGYCFETPQGSSYPPIVAPSLIEHGRAFAISGPAGDIVVEPLPVAHGDIVSLCLRIGGIAYVPDVSGIPADTAARLRDLDLLVIDALQPRPHPSHFSLGQSLEWIERLEPRNAILTHMHIPLDHDAVERATPDHVHPAHDGMAVEFPYVTG
jgi:phosphoribosyl 1,2-cyclic phosphate phosphodiesterase